MDTETFAGMLRRAGFRATKGRLRLLAALARASGPISARELARTVRGFDEANIYRALKAFAEQGLVHVVQFERERVRFELARGHHHHMVCTACGAVEGVHIAADRVLDRQALACSSFASVQSHRLEFFGLCVPCARRC